MTGFVNFPAALAAALQTGFLEREFEEGLDSVLAYRREVVEETIPARIGQTLTSTRKGRYTPIDTPITPASNTGLDNGLTPRAYSIEQYSFTMNQYADTADVQMQQELAGIANDMFAASRNQGVQAAQSMERICRRLLFSAYLGGNTNVRTDLGAGSTTTCFVDDIRGFQNVLVNGVLTAVSGGNPITVTEVNAGGSGVNQTLTVNTVTAEVTNHSLTPGGISGTLTFTAATTPVNGDQLIALNAPKILRPNNRATAPLLKGSDILTLGLCLDAVTYMRDNAIPPMSDGTFHLILDNTSMRQLFADQDFKVAYAGRGSDSPLGNADIVTLLGITFIPTTETYVQAVGVQANGAATATGASLPSVRIRRPIMMGAESIIQGNFAGLENWLDREGVNPIHDVYLVNNVAHVIRPPLDRLAETASLSWKWIGDFAVPSDLTATTAIIPTATNALYKRCVVLETAG